MSKDNFEQRLLALHRKSCEDMPTPQLATIQRSTVMLKRSGIEQSSLQVGESVADFSFASQWSDQTSLYQLLKTGPVVLNFFRGFWCRYCQEELAEYQQVIPQLVEKQGVHYMAVSPQQLIDNQIDRQQCHLVVDDQLTIARQFGIVHQVPEAQQDIFKHYGMSLAKVNNTENWELPLPATYVINQQRQVQFRSVNADFRQRLNPHELLDLLA